MAVQGDVSEHVDALKMSMQALKIDGTAVTVRSTEDMRGISGLVIPGGESTTISRLMLASGIHEKVLELAKKGLPILGTCAGAILLAKEGDTQVSQTNTKLLGLLDMSVLRNGYGRQADSFEADLKITEIGKEPFKAVFIRSPIIEKVWGDTKVWVRRQSEIVGARKGNLIALTFHPELSGDLRFHMYFLKTILDSSRIKSR